ncbi:cation transporter [Caldimonas tepidiphila]|uniref:cation transporter n=1 Tax=Caldimonas tepidiphila TaxID=2315841 RepID=UPI000E5C4B36|nr:cation transporter [Caldimonas tepidiphila]
MACDCHDHCEAPAARRRAADPRWRRVLWIALLVNAAMFALEFGAGVRADSAALLADAVDFAGDALNYGLSLAVLGMAAVWGTRLALLKGVVMALWGVGVLAQALFSALHGSAPQATLMGGVGLLALAANLGVAALLWRWRDGDANAESVWLCSRNDALGNAAIVLAALGVFGTGSAWPDLLVAAIMAALALSAGVRVMRRSRRELREAQAAAG